MLEFTEGQMYCAAQSVSWFTKYEKYIWFLPEHGNGKVLMEETVSELGVDGGLEKCSDT